MSQHGYMRHTATPPLVLDLIRLIQSGAEKVDCFSIGLFTQLLRLQYSLADLRSWPHYYQSGNCCVSGADSTS